MVRVLALNNGYVKVIVDVLKCNCRVYVTEYWKTDQNVMLGLLYFIGPANSHTHKRPVLCCMNRVS